MTLHGATVWNTNWFCCSAKSLQPQHAQTRYFRHSSVPSAKGPPSNKRAKQCPLHKNSKLENYAAQYNHTKENEHTNSFQIESNLVTESGPRQDLFSNWKFCVRLVFVSIIACGVSVFSCTIPSIYNFFCCWHGMSRSCIRFCSAICDLLWGTAMLISFAFVRVSAIGFVFFCLSVCSAW